MRIISEEERKLLVANGKARYIYRVTNIHIPEITDCICVLVNTDMFDNSSITPQDIVDFVKKEAFPDIYRDNAMLTENAAKQLLEEREKTHGKFKDVASISQGLRRSIRLTPHYPRLSEIQKEALDNIAQKMARILAGNPDFPDHWADIAGYATLAEIHCTKKNEEKSDACSRT